MTLEEEKQELEDIRKDSDELVESVRQLPGQEALVKKLETIRDAFKTLTVEDMTVINSLDM
jgi:hypothetical protein